MPKVDHAVITELTEKIFEPKRLITLVEGYLDQSKLDAQQQRNQLGQLKGELTETDGAIKRLLKMVETELMEIDDPALRERLQELKARRLTLQAKIARVDTSQPATRQRLTEAKLHKLSTTLRDALRNAPPELRKAYVKLFVDEVIISKQEIRMSGPKGLLAPAAFSDLPDTPAKVITFVREWRPVHDKTRHWNSLIFWA